MSFNTDKCGLIHSGKSNPGLKNVMVNPAVNNIQELQSVDEERDLGIVADNQRSFHSKYKKMVSHANFDLALLKKKLFPVGLPMFS